MHQSSEILKTLGGVPQECLKRAKSFRSKSNGNSPQRGWPNNNRCTQDTSKKEMEQN